MKHIHIFGIVLIVAIIASAVATLACDDLKAIRDTAEETLEAAKREFRESHLKLPSHQDCCQRLLPP